MAYSLIVSPRAQREITHAIDYYSLYSIDAPLNLISALGEAYGELETNPFFGVRYKNIRALKLKGFPYLLYFIINEKKGVISILSCFHNKINPHKRPGY